MEGIKSIVESPEANEWARGGALGSFVPLTLAGELGRDETIAYFAQLLQGKLKREPSQVWNALITCCCDLGANELMGDIERAYAEELVDLEYTSLGEVEDAMAGFKDSRHTARLIEDAGAEMEHWGCLQLKPQV